jgi:uncharacterized protein (DUF1684 family)
MTDTAAYLAALEAWKELRLRRLKAPEGWLNIVGRWELEPGTVSIGSAPGSDIVLPVGPAALGTLTQEPTGIAWFSAADDSPPIRLEPNKKNTPKIAIDRFIVELMTLNGENALRIRDTKSAEPDRLAPIDYFDPAPDWRIVADWVPYAQPQSVTVGTTKDIDTEVEATHKAVFTRDGHRFELIATHGTPQAPQFVIRDLTARDSTYPAARFVYGEEVTDKSIVLDFNKAINPPCAFTEYAVCPLPPPENVLPIRIEAGEKWPH